MKFKAYIEENQVNLKSLAEDLGVSHNYVTYLRDNKRRPSPQLALKIETITNGQVSRLELLYP